MKSIAFILLSLLVSLLSSCCCEDKTYSRSIFEIEYNHSYQGQFNIDGIYISEDTSRKAILIFYDDGKVFNDPNNSYYRRIYFDLFYNEYDKCHLTYDSVNGPEYSWHFYETFDDHIMLEGMVHRSYCSEEFVTSTYRLNIINDSTLGTDYSRYRLVKCEYKPEAMDYWWDR